jgi:hypothetical protein
MILYIYISGNVDMLNLWLEGNDELPVANIRPLGLLVLATTTSYYIPSPHAGHTHIQLCKLISSVFGIIDFSLFFN